MELVNKIWNLGLAALVAAGCRAYQCSAPSVIETVRDMRLHEMVAKMLENPEYKMTKEDHVIEEAYEWRKVYMQKRSDEFLFDPGAADKLRDYNLRNGLPEDLGLYQTKGMGDELVWRFREDIDEAKVLRTFLECRLNRWDKRTWD